VGAMALLAWDACSRDQLQHYHQNRRAAIPKSIPRGWTHKTANRRRVTAVAGMMHDTGPPGVAGSCCKAPGRETPGAPICKASSRAFAAGAVHAKGRSVAVRWVVEGDQVHQTVPAAKKREYFGCGG